MTPNQKLVQAKVNDVLQKALDLYGNQYPRVKFYLAMIPPVSFDIRGYRTAAMARRTKDGRLLLRFHPKFVEDHLDEILRDTAAHEVAHLVCMAEPQLGRMHNAGWRQVCLALGGDGTRCGDGSINLGRPTPEQRLERSLSLRPHVYTDSTGIARRVTTRVHNRIQLGVSYRWRKGGGRVNKDSPYRYEPHKRPAAVVKQAAHRPAVTDLGGKSKADVCRELIKAHYGSMTEQALVMMIAQKAGLSVGLAKKYFSNNLAKAFMA